MSDTIESLHHQLAESQLKADANARGFSDVNKQLAECQAREKVLRDELEHADEVSPTISESRDAALAMPFDSTALNEAIKQAKREALLEAAEWFADIESDLDTGRDIAAAQALRRMAEELK